MDKIVVLDCGGQYAHLIANRIRRLHVRSEIRLNNEKAKNLKGYKGIIISGGPNSVNNPDSPKLDPEIFKLGVPVLGICYGHQLLNYVLGGKIIPGEVREYGLTRIERIKTKLPYIFSHLKKEENVWMSHWDEVIKVPEGFYIYYKTRNSPAVIIGDPERHFYGIQFHAEVTHTSCGMEILDKFLEICEVKREWSIDNFLEEEMKKIKKQVGKNKVFLLTSGGVDSTVTFLLLSKTLGTENVYGLFVDTGLMRKKEVNEVEQNMKELGFTNLHIEYAADEYFSALKERYEPEKKRNIIGEKFLEIADRYTKNMRLEEGGWILAQGTIYPDTIESGGTKHASKIKTHHNRIEAIEELIKKGLIVEPIKDLYKDEVRELGERLGLHKDLVWRHPFPGPGLGVRILCVKEEDRLENEASITSKIEDHYKLSSSVLPIKSVGVQGDLRTYKHPLAIYTDFREKSWGEWEELGTSIVNQFNDINRVILSFSPALKPEFLTIIPGYLTPKRVKVLQEIDAIVMKITKESRILADIWQFPVVLLPVSCDGKKESVVLRPVCSENAMTANFAKIDYKIIEKIIEEVMNKNLISMLFFDLTSKPPGTIEWE